MNKFNSKVFLFLGFALFLSLVLWNVYLTNKITEYNKNEHELELKLDVCKGDVMVLNDELVTVRDSIRILNNKLNE